MTMWLMYFSICTALVRKIFYVQIILLLLYFQLHLFQLVFPHFKKLQAISCTQTCLTNIFFFYMRSPLQFCIETEHTACFPPGGLLDNWTEIPKLLRDRHHHSHHFTLRLWTIIIKTQYAWFLYHQQYQQGSIADYHLQAKFSKLWQVLYKF